jgi:hypothetical protein
VSTHARLRVRLCPCIRFQVLLAVHAHTQLQVAVKVMNPARVRKQNMEGKVGLRRRKCLRYSSRVLSLFFVDVFVQFIVPMITLKKKKVLFLQLKF